MATIRELIEFASEYMLRSTSFDDLDLIDPDVAPGLVSEFRALKRSFETYDKNPEQLLIHLDRIRRISTDALISSNPGSVDDKTRHWLNNVSRSAADYVSGIIMHEDYKPPRGYPPPQRE